MRRIHVKKEIGSENHNFRKGLNPENLVPPSLKDGGVSRLEMKEGGRRALLAILRKKVSLG